MMTHFIVFIFGLTCWIQVSSLMQEFKADNCSCEYMLNFVCIKKSLTIHVKLPPLPLEFYRTRYVQKRNQ